MDTTQFGSENKTVGIFSMIPSDKRPDSSGICRVGITHMAKRYVGGAR